MTTNVTVCSASWNELKTPPDTNLHPLYKLKKNCNRLTVLRKVYNKENLSTFTVLLNCKCNMHVSDFLTFRLTYSAVPVTFKTSFNDTCSSQQLIIDFYMKRSIMCVLLLQFIVQLRTALTSNIAA